MPVTSPSTVDVAGVSLTDQGRGRAALLLHGIGGNARSWTAVSALLAAHERRALCWDAPGYGRSADPRTAADGDHPARVVAVLDACGIEAVDLVGTSWGGVIATVVAARWPDRVRSLVLADSTAGAGADPRSAAAMRARVDDLAARGAGAFATDRAPALVSPDADPAAREAVRAAMAEVRLPGYRAAAAFMMATDTTALLATITVPTLVLVGEHDRVTGPERSRTLAEGIPGAVLTVVGGAGHAAVTERPEAVAAAMLDFWATR